MLKNEFTIGNMAEAGGVKVQTVRYYEQIGLLPSARRTAGNHRLYTKDHMDLLKFVRHSRSLGFSLDQIRELLALRESPGGNCEEIDEIARKHLLDVESKISRLRELETELKHMVGQCAGGTVSSCRIIEALSDHTHCIGDHHLTGDH